jgi:hypothetical protein
MYLWVDCCRFSVVKTYCGHGIGDLFHVAPNIPHYANNKAVGVMKEGQVSLGLGLRTGIKQKGYGNWQLEVQPLTRDICGIRLTILGPA